MIDVSELMSDPDFAQPFSVRRPTAGSFVPGTEGVYQQGYQVVSLIGVVQPAEPDEAQRLPEGIRVDNVRMVFCADEIRAGDAKARNGDILQLPEGGNWHVFKVERWADNGYWLAYAEGIVT